jgi:hypothetical protein
MNDQQPEDPRVRFAKERTPTIDKMLHWMHLLGWESTSDCVGNYGYVVAIRGEHKIIARADTFYRAWWGACHQVAKIQRDGK